MGRRGVGEHGGRQAHVVRAEHRDRKALEGQIDQRLVLHARGILAGAAAEPDRLVDDPGGRVGPCVDDGVHHLGEDASGVAAHLGHVEQPHAIGGLAQAGADQLQVRPGQGGADGGPLGQPVEQEGDDARQQLGGIPVEERGVGALDESEHRSGGGRLPAPQLVERPGAVGAGQAEHGVGCR